jgi:hypothetical protein
MRNLISMHVPGGDRPDVFFAIAVPDRENYKNCSATSGPPDCPEPFLAPRMSGVGKDHHAVGKKSFNLGAGNTVLATFAFVSSSQSNPAISISYYTNVYTEPQNQC